MEKTIKSVSALGIPGLIVFYVLTTCGFTGTAAVAISLAAMGPFANIGGVTMLVLAGIIFATIAKYGFDELNEGIVREYQNNSVSKEDIHDWISSRWFLSKAKKAYLDEIVTENFS